MEFSKRSQKLTSSPLYVFARKVKEYEASGRPVISLGLGEPYYDTPEPIKQAGIDAINSNKTHYNPSTGSLELRKALANKYGVELDSILVSSGAKPFLGSVLWSLVDDGDMVLMAGPYYPPFYQIAESCGGEVTLIDTKPAGFKLTTEAVRKTLALRRPGQGAVIIINSPNNPSGVVTPKAELQKIVELCLVEGVRVISDECYAALSAEPDFSVREYSNQVIVINAFSKAYAMTGWRVGYAVCPPELATVVGRYLDCYVGCPSSISDAAAVEALKQPTVQDFVEQRELIEAWFREHEIEFSESQGGIFSFPDFSKIMRKLSINNSVELASYFLEKAGVATTPGVAFGEQYDTHLRMTYCLKIDDLKKALEQLKTVI